jgi:long-chain acyl-CoA synthetase
MQTSARQNYPADVPHEIDPGQYRSLPHMFDEAFARYAERPFSVCMERWMSYGELDTLSKALGAWLQSLGLEPGARVAIMLPNVPQFAVTMCGVLRAGYTCVNVNPLYTARELEHQLKDSGATAIVILENFAATLEQVIERTPVKHVVVTSMGDLLGGLYGAWITVAVRHLAKMVPPYKLPLGNGRSVTPFSKVIEEGRGRALAPDQSTLDSIAFLQYTGGTTGVAKGAMLTHRNMIANVLQAGAWLGTESRLGEDTVITPLPLYHIFALTGNLMVFIKLGARNVLIANPRDFPAFVAELRQWRFSFISGVNTLFNALLHTPGFAELDFSELRITLGGGMAVQRTVAEHWQRVTGNVLTQAWGLTETSPAACVNPFEAREFNGSIGLPISSTEITIRNDEGRELPIGEVGEICVRGPQVMLGYWNRPDETAQVMIGDWLRTGDIGRMDHGGFVYIEDRKKDMILVSGFNVYPNEIESVVAAHPGVLEVAAVAQEDERSGEAVALFVVKKDPNLTEQQLIDYCKGELTGYKVPRHVYFRTDLPKTNVGKILRRELRDSLKAKA